MYDFFESGARGTRTPDLLGAIHRRQETTGHDGQRKYLLLRAFPVEAAPSTYRRATAACSPLVRAAFALRSRSGCGHRSSTTMA